MRYKRLFPVALLLLMMLGATIWAATNAIGIPWSAISSGGGRISGGSVVIEGTIGQAAAGHINGGKFDLQAGFQTGLGSAGDLIVYLPTVFNNHIGGHLEKEPNNDPGSANGPYPANSLIIGSPDDAHPGEERDWFSFNYGGSGKIVVDLNGFLAQGQLLLFKDGNYTTVLGSAVDQGSGNYHVEYNGGAGAGVYKIFVFAPANHPKGNGDYTLSVTVQ